MLKIEPDVDAFPTDRPTVVWATLVADLETPVSAFLKLAEGRPNAVLLESVEGGAVRGRYSILALAPDVIWRCQGAVAAINRHALTAPDAFEPCAEPPLEALRALIAESAIELPPGLPPMAAGIFGYLGYDMVRLMEKLAPAKPDPIGVPDAILVRPTIVVVFDAVRDEITVVTPVRPAPGGTPRQAYDRAVDRLTEIVERLDAPLDKTTPAADPGALTAELTSNTTPAEYHAMVAKAKEYILAGDIFQVVLAQRFEAPFTLPPFALYRALRRVNPAPFLVYLSFDDFSLVCSSPEILVRLREGKVTIRPIAGTRPRGSTPAEDHALEAELLADPKELSEHLMLLDLGRNDVGRVSAIGTVTVTDKFFIERYSHVMHIVSNVEGTLDSKQDALDALIAGFPAGTVSGAPKVRAMQIIDELEKDKRGPYAGAIGYFGAGGDMDSCIVLRTSVVKDGRMYVQAGAGIVHDSVPASEQAECVNKAKAQFRAADEARRFAASVGRGQ
ncbi:anthranilate synthase component I [Blastochloris viridis]|uniref:Anthranilate synthase component 1 n=1 Tax=Blastochloris viridis TaxID=1079 RepID=A0A0H5BJR5_BLAVI|nr:anthranilate synthase component I [Blastochloris viridis]ALK09384.1 Anthranilate synthase component 1 [Blastochloris viridis]BAS00737.1 anthranilate synthase [Blastochloris viridis]CUU42047.1 Anthranilate synthase component 1 [Blastochloris viridis]